MAQKEEIEKSITQYLRKQPDILFVYLFGSFIERESYRDIDVAVYFQPDIKLLRQGELIAGLELMTKVDIDLIRLNRLYKKRPAFAYEILKKGRVIINKNQEIHHLYKSKTLRYYLDTNYLRKMMDEAFEERMKDNRFGESTL